MSLSQEITHSLLHALDTLGFSNVDITIEPTSNPKFGDYTSNVAMQVFPQCDKQKWNSPRSLAQAIVREVMSHPDFASHFLPPTIAGAGFINFTVTNTVFTQRITELSTQVWNFDSENKGKTAIVEYSSPNIAKPFTVGHLRSTIIGDTLANLLDAIGYDVKRDNHLGDWGTQFGKQIVALLELGEGSEAKNIERISNAEEPVKELVKLYVEFHDKAETDPSLEDKGREWFTKLENGDAKARELWQLCIDWSWKEFARIYSELGVSFTENGGRGYGESFFEDKMTGIVKELEESGYLREGNEGAKLFFFPDDILSPLMILKKDGSTLYATRDLATDKFRLEKYGKDILVINEVGAEQALYFRQLFKIEELLGWYAPGTRVHVKHGLFRFKEGKMSTRKGNTIWLEDVITEAKKRALTLSKTQNEETAAIVAIGSLKWNDLKRSSHLDIAFDWNEILTMEGNSGAYMQYTVVRALSVLAKENNGSKWETETTTLNPSERSLAQQLLYFEETVKRAATEYTPQLLCTYLYTLAGVFNSFYTTNRILGEVEHESKRLALTKATAAVLEEGLNLLGISVPKEM